MNKYKLSFVCLLSCCCACVTTAVADDIEMNTARMQAMDKITGHVTEIDVPVKGVVNFGSFSILVRKCVTRSPDEAPENTAFVDVVDDYESDNPVNIFKGWMFSSTPALSPVEHPIYDVWLLQCYNNNHLDKSALLTEEQLALRDTLPMQRMEKVKINVGNIEDMTDVENQSDIKAELPSNESKEIVKETEGGLSDDDFVSEGEEDVFGDTASDTATSNE